MWMKEYHLHFTGSLPISFIKSIIQITNSTNSDLFLLMTNSKTTNEFMTMSESQIKANLQNFIKSNQGNLFENFMLAYQEIHNLTKNSPSQKLYYEWTCAILQESISKNITQLELLAGIKPIIEGIFIKYSNIIKAFQDTERKYNLPKYSFKIRVTLSRNQNLRFSNIHKNTLNDLRDFFHNNPEFTNYFSGFDISWFENNSDKAIQGLEKMISELANFNQEFTKFDISIHAGENLPAQDYTQNIKFFESLLNLPIKRIGHWTFLWHNLNNQKIELLKKFAENWIAFDICPQSNLDLTWL